jgi:hypothetical protein
MGLALGKFISAILGCSEGGTGLCQKWQLVPLGLEIVSGLVYALDESDVHES